MKRIALAAATVLCAALVGGATRAPAGNLSQYDGASWYAKYLAVSGQAPVTCSSNSGSLGQISYGSNVSASHECGSQSETSIAINPANAKNVIAGSNEIQRLPMRAMYSTDGGKTFTGVDLPLPPSRTNNGFDFGSDPGVAFDSNGNAYYSYIVVFFSSGGAINGTEMAVAHSTDGGATWTATYFNPQTGNGQFNDKPMITVDTGRAHHNRIYVAWDNATGNSSSDKNGNNVLLAYSDDGGATFSTPVSVSGPFTGRTGAIGADPYVTANGTLHVAWQDDAHSTIDDAVSTDGGQTFSSPNVIAPVNAFQFNVAAQASRGALVYPSCGSYKSTLYCSYMNGSDAATSVYVARSTDGGTTWTSTAVPAGGDQFNQWLAVDPKTGAVVVSWSDSRNDSTRHSTEYFIAESTNGGASFSTAAQIATQPTDETVAGADLGNQYGDYEGVAAFGGEIHPIWVDRRASIAAVQGLDEEIFTATVKE